MENTGISHRRNRSEGVRREPLTEFTGAVTMRLDTGLERVGRRQKPPNRGLVGRKLTLSPFSSLLPGPLIRQTQREVRGRIPEVSLPGMEHGGEVCGVDREGRVARIQTAYSEGTSLCSEGWPHGYNLYDHGGHEFMRAPHLVQCSPVTTLKLLIFEQGARHFNFALSPTNSIAHPDSILMTA